MPTYGLGATARCLHCSTVVHFEHGRTDAYYNNQGTALRLTHVTCPSCHQIITTVEPGTGNEDIFLRRGKEFIAWPRHSARPIPPEVPSSIADDYQEAASTLSLSPKASAALSRRCLQAVLRDAANANQRDLWQQIDAVLPTLPSYIAQDLDAIRHIGNFAAHPAKFQATGQIIDVEPGEAEWNLDVLDLLFDFYYVQPALAQKKRDALNAKLQAAGKLPMK